MLTVDQVANLLKMKPTTIRTWLKEGKLNGVKVGREWRVTKDELKNAFPQGSFYFPVETTKALNVDVRNNTELLKELYPEAYEEEKRMTEQVEHDSWKAFGEEIVENLERRFPYPWLNSTFVHEDGINVTHGDESEAYAAYYEGKYNEEMNKLNNLLLILQKKYGIKDDDVAEIKRTSENLLILRCGKEYYRE